MATSPEALTAALGPERELLPDARDLSDDQRFVLWLTANRTDQGLDLWACANNHPTIALPGLPVGRVRCDRGCGGLRLVARVRRKEAME